MTPILVGTDMTVKIGAARLIDRVSLAFSPGATVAIVGPNGAGKTTLLRLLSGEITPRPGRVDLKGRRIAEYGARALACHRAVLSQSVSVAFPFTVRDIVRMGAGTRCGGAIDALVETALDELDLAEFAPRIVTTLSGGEQQRVHFARVLVQLACGEAMHGPGVLLLDEPTASLDLKHQIELLTIAKGCAKRGAAVIAVLHDLNLAALFADRIVVMQRGRVHSDGPPARAITSGMVEHVFGIALQVGHAPTELPFILPQTVTPAA
jgi:iron complex transport system ATP-binding protein